MHEERRIMTKTIFINTRLREVTSIYDFKKYLKNTYHPTHAQWTELGGDPLTGINMLGSPLVV